MKLNEIIPLFLSKPGFFMAKAPKAIRHRVKKIVLLANRLLVANGTSILPQEVSFCITSRCNLRCKMCGQWGKSGITKADPQRIAQKGELSLPQLKKVVADVSRFKPLISIWGGEPLLREDLFQFVGFIKKQNLFCNIITNGVLLEKRAEEAVQSGLDFLCVSLDGPEAGHDAIRGAGSFQKSIRGIREMQRVKKALSKPRPYLHIGSVILEENYRRLEEIVDIALELEVDSLSLVHAWSIEEERGLKYERFMHDQLKCRAQSWKGFLDTGNKIDHAKLAAIVARIHDKSRNHPRLIIRFYPDVPPRDISRYYNDPGFSLGRKSCNAPWYKADIRPNGEVTFCGDYPDYLIGNVKDHPFLNIWNNTRARAFRKLLRKSGMFPICTRCCGLYMC